MPATTSHQQLQVEQQITTDALGFETPVVEIQPDRAWLLQQLLAACDADRTLWHELRRAHWIETVDDHGVEKRREIVEQLAARSGLATAWTMVETLDEANQLRDALDAATDAIGSCGHDSCDRPALHGSEFCDAHLDGVDEFRIGA